MRRCRNLAGLERVSYARFHRRGHIDPSGFKGLKESLEKFLNKCLKTFLKKFLKESLEEFLLNFINIFFLKKKIKYQKWIMQDALKELFV